LGKEETGRAQGSLVKKTHEEKGQGCQLKEEKGRRRGKYNQTPKLVWFDSSVRRFFKIRVGYVWIPGCVLSGRQEEYKEDNLIIHKWKWGNGWKFEARLECARS